MFVAVGVTLWVRATWRSPLPVPEGGYVFTIESGSSLRTLTRNLSDDAILPAPRLFTVLARMQGADSRIRPGEYRLAAGSTAADLLAQIQSGDTLRYLVTLPEGIRLQDAIAILQQAEGIEAILKPADPDALFDAFPELPFLEGYFLAETYQYERGATDLDLLRQAHSLAVSTLGSSWERRAPGLPYASPEEALIMASIIEKETAVPAERPLISGVFVRRLQRDMRLQTDPTVIYGLGSSYDGNLTRAHLRDENNMFNTYRHKGLPPTPIALPGRAAIEAALHPAEGDALYFVARGDGTHAFNATLEAHEADVRRYQLERRSDYRSTPEGLH